MSEVKHTPGPWSIEDADGLTDTVSVFSEEGEWMICDLGMPTDLMFVAREDLNPAILAQQAANARLIAAAPDLLDIVYRVAFPGPHEGQMTPDELLTSALAIYTKATSNV